MRLTLWAAVAAATLLRLFCVAIPAEEGFLQADSPSYLGPAMALLSTGEYRSCPGCDTPSFRLPLYPAFVASVFSPFGSCPRCVVAAQHLIAIGSAALLATAVGLGAGPWIRALVFLFLLANIQMIAQASVVLRESVTGSVVCLSLWLAAKPLDRLPRTIGLGLTVGSLGLCRPEYWPLAVLFPLVLALDGPRRGQRARFVPFVLVLAACSPLAAWFIRSQIVAPQTGLSTDSLTSVVSHLMLRRIEAHDRGLSIEAAGALVRERFPKGKGLPSPIALVWTRPWAVTRSCLEASGRFWFLPGGYGELLEVFQQPLASPLKQLIAGPQSVNWKAWLIERPGVFFLMIANVAQVALLNGALLAGLTRKRVPWTDAGRLALLIVAAAAIAGVLTGDARVRGCAIPAIVLLAARAFTPRRPAATSGKSEGTPAIGASLGQDQALHASSRRQ